MRIAVDCSLEFDISESTKLPLHTALDRAHELADQIEQQFGITVVLGESYEQVKNGDVFEKL